MVTPDSDLERLLRLIGMLGSPKDGGFWDSWKKDLDGYAFNKMKAFIARTADPEPSPTMVRSFGGYVLKFFSTDSEEEEAALIEKVGGYVSPHAENQPAIQFLDDIRRTAWRLYRDYSQVTADEVVRDWAQAER